MVSIKEVELKGTLRKMNSCLTCLFYDNRSVPWVAQSKPLHIKKTVSYKNKV